MTQRDRTIGGQALAEFAIVIPVLIVMLLAIFDIGRGVFMYTSITNAAREGARLAIVNQDTTLIEDRIRGQSAVAETDGSDGSDIEVNFYRSDGNGNPDVSEECDPPIQLGCLAVVRFETSFEPIIPLIGQFIFSGGFDMTAETVLPVEFTCPNNSVTNPLDCPKQP